MAGIPVLIFGADHPHCGATGTLTDDFIQPRDGGLQMVRVDLDEPRDGVAACYCTAPDLMPVTFSYAGER